MSENNLTHDQQRIIVLERLAMQQEIKIADQQYALEDAAEKLADLVDNLQAHEEAVALYEQFFSLPTWRQVYGLIFAEKAE